MVKKYTGIFRWGLCWRILFVIVNAVAVGILGGDCVIECGMCSNQLVIYRLNQMTHAIIRGIWGEGDGHTDHDLAATIAAAKNNGDMVDRVYCYGRQNADILRRCGYVPVMLNAEPYATPKLHDEKMGYRATRWGVNYWRHKAMILQAALRDFDEVLWTDFDVRQQQPLPNNFWEELSSGPELRAPLAIQRSSHNGAWWRNTDFVCTQCLPPGTVPIPGKQGKLAARVVPAGGYIYMRGRDVADKFLAIHEEYDQWSGQPCMALLIDQMYDGWPGVKKYVENGHEVSDYYYPGSLFVPEPNDIIWQCGLPAGRLHYLKRNIERFLEV